MSFNYPTAVHFQCTKCGICCGDTKEKTRHILLLKTEAEQIATTTSQPTAAFTTKTKDKTPYNYEMKKTKKGKCIFLKNNHCTIYTTRPLICRYYPFELKTTHNGKHTFLHTPECPGINKGPILNKNYFRKLLRLAHARSRQTADPKRRS
jgi:Fe-S-cluster containining protein